MLVVEKEEWLVVEGEFKFLYAYRRFSQSLSSLRTEHHIDSRPLIQIHRTPVKAKS